MLSVGPGWYDVQTVIARLTENQVGIEGAQVHSVVTYAEVKDRWPESGYEITDETGKAWITIDLANAPADSTVQVDLYFLHDGETYRASTSLEVPC